MIRQMDKKLWAAWALCGVPLGCSGAAATPPPAAAKAIAGDQAAAVSQQFAGAAPDAVSATPPTLAPLALAPKVPGTLALHARSRDQATAREKTVEWAACETAIIICDMWRAHSCAQAAERGDVMAPRMNAVVSRARDLGVTIVHAPSSGMHHYAETEARRRVQSAPHVATEGPLEWCSLDSSKELPLPIDDSDGGFDDPVPNGERTAARADRLAQHEAIHILGYDGLSDDGHEIHNFFQQQGIKNVLLMGVHTNMCVLGRPFGIRSLTKLGYQVMLVRDLTDAMYDPRDPPYVSHARGTELVVEHVEHYWCPSIHSSDLAQVKPGSAGPLHQHGYRQRVAGNFELSARSRPKDSSDAAVIERTLRWPAAETALIVCDVRDAHWCAATAQRSADLAPRINRLVTAARSAGVQIVHAPSGAVGAYAGTPQRERVLRTVRYPAPNPLVAWRPVDRAREGSLPIEPGAGECDCPSPCKPSAPWKRQDQAVPILAGDVVSDDAQEIYDLFRLLGITRVIYCGGQSNEGVLSAPFGIRQMTALGFEAVLARDLTDVLYNPRRRPELSQRRAAELMIEHVERHWCPTVLGGELFSVSNRLASGK
jgi:nicotinamidase-related amidase